MTDDIERDHSREVVCAFAKKALVNCKFIPGETTVPVSGKAFDPNEFAALVDSSLDGWLTARRFHTAFERELANMSEAEARSPLTAVRALGTADDSIDSLDRSRFPASANGGRVPNGSVDRSADWGAAVTRGN